MNQVVIVHFFGKFCLETDIGYLDEEKIHSKKLITLLAFFLLNYNRMIPAEELGELMWGNGGSSNPIGALKNLIYRLRNILKQLGTAEYIVSQAGRYGWNNEIESNRMWSIVYLIIYQSYLIDIILHQLFRYFFNISSKCI